MTLALFLKLAHVLASIWLIAGIIGRTVVLKKAENARDIRDVCALLPVARVFEQAMVVPGSTAVLVAGLVTAWAQGWPILGFLQGGTSNWVFVSLLLFLTIIPVIALIFVPRGKIFDVAFQSAVDQGQVTPELTGAFRDPIVRAGHIYELSMLAVIVALMVLKPF